MRQRWFDSGQQNGQVAASLFPKDGWPTQRRPRQHAQASGRGASGAALVRLVEQLSGIGPLRPPGTTIPATGRAATLCVTSFSRPQNQDGLNRRRRDESEFGPAGTPQTTKMHRRNITVTGSAQTKEKEPAADPATSTLPQQHGAQGPAYVDHAVWGPDDRKAVRANNCRTWIPTANGKDISRVLPVNENFQPWQASRRVFAVAPFTLELVSEAALANFEQGIEKLTRVWPSAWHLTAVADKCRA